MSDGSTPLIVFHNGSPIAESIIYTRNENIKYPDRGYDFVPSIDSNGLEDWVAQNYMDTGETYVYTPSIMKAPTEPKLKLADKLKSWFK